MSKLSERFPNGDDSSVAYAIAVRNHLDSLRVQMYNVWRELQDIGESLNQGEGHPSDGDELLDCAAAVRLSAKPVVCKGSDWWSYAEARRKLQ